jgi:hypothetical protein
MPHSLGYSPSANHVIAIDGRPASPAMAAALEAITRNAQISRNRTAAINADPRVIHLRSMKAPISPNYDAEQMVADFVSGRAARDQRINALVRARIGQIDRNVFAVRENLRHAARLRWEKGFVVKASAEAAA